MLAFCAKRLCSAESMLDRTGSMTLLLLRVLLRAAVSAVQRSADSFWSSATTRQPDLPSPFTADGDASPSSTAWKNAETTPLPQLSSALSHVSFPCRVSAVSPNPPNLDAQPRCTRANPLCVRLERIEERKRVFRRLVHAAIRWFLADVRRIGRGDHLISSLSKSKKRLIFPLFLPNDIEWAKLTFS